MNALHYRFPWWITATLLAGSMLCGCYRNDIQETEINVPALARPECAEILLRQLLANRRTSPVFIVDAKFEPERRIVRVTYNARTLSLRNLEYMISDLGYEVHSSRPTGKWNPYIIPANAEARAKLPEGCR